MENNAMNAAQNINSVAFVAVPVMEKPVYPELRCIGKTCGQAATGTIDRKVIARRILTLDVIEKDYIAVAGDGVKFVTVAPVESVNVFVEMVGGLRSLASFKFFNVFNAANAENDGVSDIFVDADGSETDKIERMLECAARMSDAHPECDGQYKFVTEDGTRVFVRTYAAVSKSGMIARD